MIKYIWLALILPLPLTAQQVITAEDAIAIGLKNNFDIQIAKNNREISNNNIGKGIAEFLPSLGINGNHQYSLSQQETNSPFSFGDSDSRNTSGQISLNWTLFDGFKMFTTHNQFKDLARLGEFQARNLIENTVVAILRSYFNVVQQEELLDVAQNALEISKTRLEKEKVRQDLGGASSTDLLNAQVSYNNDYALVLNQELGLSIAKKDLNILLGRKPESAIEVKKQITVNELSIPLEQLLAMALERNSDLSIAEQNKIIADQDIRIRRSFFYPVISFSANYGYADRTTHSESSRFTEDINQKSADASLGLTFSYNLFNGKRDKIELQNAQLAAKNTELALQNIRNQINGLVREKVITFGKRMELIHLEEQNVIAAQQNLRLQQDRYSIGASSSLEFRDAQVNLTRAQSTLIAARYQARISKLEIEQLIGILEFD
jgi:outer membrane protein TolC